MGFFTTRRLFALAILAALLPSPVDAATFYVSSSGGNDDNDGLSEVSPFATIDHINGLALAPGDQVLLRCGDVWRVDPLIITRSGDISQKLTFGSYPADCSNRPVLSGARPISGWSLVSGNLYSTSLAAGANAGSFASGVNQLFDGDGRLTLGRWPNLDNGDGGYTPIDSSPGGTQLVDADLSGIDWSGAAVHAKGIRWYIMNRTVASSSGATLNLNDAISCYQQGSGWGSDCSGWGYFINNHLAALDVDREWYYDDSSSTLYLVSTSGAPADGEIEGSVVLTGDVGFDGGILIGAQQGDTITDVVISNLEVSRWYDNGITTPRNPSTDEPARIEIRDCLVADVDAIGIQLSTWAWNPTSGPDGWRGGSGHVVTGNTVQGANQFGIDTYSINSQISGNQIRDIGLIPNLGANGMGCGFSGTNCTENGAGIRLKLDPGKGYSATGNTIAWNRIERVGMNGIDVFGPSNVLEYNFIHEACYSKGDCGAVRTFGRDSLAASEVHDGIIRFNIIVDTIGNTDGNTSYFRPLYGNGLTIDNYSRDMVVTDNTIIGCTIDAIMYQLSTGTISRNTLYGNSKGSMTRGQIYLRLPGSSASLSDNVMYGLAEDQTTLQVDSSANVVTSDNNVFFHPYSASSILIESLGYQRLDLAGWQAYSGTDANSKAGWFTLGSTEPARSTIFYNDTNSSKVFDLGTVAYLDLDQQAVAGSMALAPFTSRILIENGSVLFGDGFESGDASRWSAVAP